MPNRLIVAVVAIAMLVAGTAVAQTVQRFSDVPADHPHADAIEWAAETGLTTGYEDGTFRPDEPLAKWAALIFVERYYDDVLESDQSDRFTRGDLMRLLHSIHTGASATSGVSEVGWLYGVQPPTVLEPGLYRLVIFLRTDENGHQTPVQMVDHGTSIVHVFDRSGHITFMELGCGYTAEQVISPTQYQHFSLIGVENAGIVYHQRLMDCPPEIELPTG